MRTLFLVSVFLSFGTLSSGTSAKTFFDHFCFLDPYDPLTEDEESSCSSDSSEFYDGEFAETTNVEDRDGSSFSESKLPNLPSLVKYAAPTALALGVNYVSNQMNIGNPVLSFFAHNISLFFGGMFFSQEVAQANTRHLKAAIAPYVPDSMLTEESKWLKQFNAQLDLVQRDPHRSPEIKRASRHLGDYFKKRSTDAKGMERSLRVLRTLVNFPQVPRVFSKKTFNQKDKKLKKVLRSYPSKVVEEARSLWKDIVVNAKYPLRKVTPRYFHGAPGTGKTHLVRLLAETLELPLLELEMRDLNAKEFLGTPDLTYSENPLGALLSSIADASSKIEGKPANVIVFLDEVDIAIRNEKQSARSQFLEDWLLRYLERAKKDIHARALDISFPIDHIIFVLAGNTTFENPALRSRVRTIDFPGYSHAFKTRIIHNFAKAYAHNLEIKLHSTDWKRINQLVNEDRNPGVRSLQNETESFLNELKLKQVSSEFD